MKKTLMLIMGFLLLLVLPVEAQNVNITNLKVEGVETPIGVETQTPTISWNYEILNDSRSFKQTAYRILVASTSQNAQNGVGDIWDSGDIVSDLNLNIKYQGNPLTSSTRYYVKVIAKSNLGTEIISPVSYFEMGLLNFSDWNGAKWIGKSQTAPSTVPAKTELWTDYDVQTDFSIISAYANIIFRATYCTNSYYGVQIEPGTANNIKVYKAYGNITDLQTFSSVEEIKESQVYTFKVTVQGNAFDFYFDGTKINAVSVVDNTLKNGTVGVGALAMDGAWGNARFDNFSVTQDGQTLFSENFEGSLNNFQDLIFPGGGKSQPENGTLNVNATNTLIDVKTGLEAPIIRKEINISKTVKQARAYVSGIGYYEMFLNGNKVGDAILEPGYSRYDKTVYYSIYDITSELKPNNVIGFELGRGWYSITTPSLWGEFRAKDWMAEPKLKAIIKIEYTDGTSETIVTDETFKVSTGGIIFDSLKAGEIYDARQEKTGWADYAYDDQSWANVIEVTPPKQMNFTSTNIANGKEVIAKSTVEAWGWAKQNMTDGIKTSTSSSMGYTSDPAVTGTDAEKWVGVNLGQDYIITKIDLYPRSDLSDYFPANYDLQVSADGTAWTTVKEIRGGSTDQTLKSISLEDVSARYVRVLGVNTIGTFLCLAEFEVWTNVVSPTTTEKELKAQLFPPIRIVEEIQPVLTGQIDSNTYYYDFGRHMAGFMELQVTGNAGQKVIVQYAEMADNAGVPFMWNFAPQSTGCYQQDAYILKGEGLETYQPKFSYKGFRYVIVSGLDYPLNSIKAKVVNSDMKHVGNFNSSSELWNKISEASRRSIQSNMHSIPTDCPTFEKLGWTCDDAAPMEAMMYYYDITKLYEKRLNDYADDISPNGDISDVLPSTWGLKGSDPAWNGSYIAIASKMYQYYGNIDLLKEHYDNMKKYLDKLTKSATQAGNPQYIVTPNEDRGYGDWCPPDHVGGRGPDGVSLHHTVYYYWYTTMMRDIAKLIGKDADYSTFNTQAENIKKAINSRYFSASENAYYFPNKAGGFRQSAQVLPLYFGLVPAGSEQAVADNLARDIKARGNHLWVGILGVEYLADVLTKYGYTDLAYKIHLQNDNPSIGNMIREGATTLWESYSLASTRSLNHKMYSTISEWFFKEVAGLRVAEDAIGSDKIIFEPKINTEVVTFANADYKSIHGTYKGGWEFNNNQFVYTLEIPANCTGVVKLPVLSYTNVEIKEGSSSIWKNNGFVSDVSGVTSGKLENNNYVFSVGSGNYIFTFTGDIADILPSGIENLPTTKEMLVGDSFETLVKVVPLNATDKTLTWLSDDTSIVSVDATGKIRAIKAGNVTITAKTINNITATCQVAVINPPTLVDELDDFSKVSDKSDNVGLDGGLGENALKAFSNDNQYIIYNLNNLKQVKARVYGVADGLVLNNLLNIYISPNGTEWTKVEAVATPQVEVGVWEWKVNDVRAQSNFPYHTNYIMLEVPTIMKPDMSEPLPNDEAWRLMIGRVELYTYSAEELATTSIQERKHQLIYMINSNLYINTNVQETIKIVGVNGLLFYNKVKPMGEIQIDTAPFLSPVIFVKGNDWTKKFLKN